MKQNKSFFLQSLPIAGQPSSVRGGRLLRLIAVLVVLLSYSRPAAAEPALELYQEAEVHFSMARFKKSLRLLQRARRQAKDPQLQAKISLLSGINLGVLKRQRQARREFERALKLDPSLTVDDRAVKPAIVELLAKVRQQLTGKVRVADYQEGSLVLVDGQQTGVVPLELTLPVGPHRLEIRTPDNKWHGEGTVLVAYGQTQSFKVGLESVEEPVAEPEQPSPVRPQVLPTPAPVEASPPRWRLYSGIAALGLGAGLVATGVVFGAKVASANDDYAAGKESLTYTELQGIADDAGRYETIQLATLISGGALLAAGGGLLLWHFLQPAGETDRPATVMAPLFGPAAFGITSTTRF